MADAADVAEENRVAIEAATPPKRYDLPKGTPGECDCGRYSPRLIGGMCGACRDETRRG
jgi:hypothetical protein